MEQNLKKSDEILTVEHVSNHYYENQLGIFSKRKKVQVLDDVSLSVRRDEFFGLVGESGSGKSTLANCVLNLIPFDGTIRVNGRTAKERDRKTFTGDVHAVFQDPLSALNPRKTIGFTLMQPLRAHREAMSAAHREAVRADQGTGTEKEMYEMAVRMLETVGLDGSYMTRYPHELSGGQRQRVCIGAALMIEPTLIIADEAISALDVSVGSQILNLFQEIHREKDFAMLFISHNLNVVYYLCDRIAVLYRGNIVEIGDAEDIYHRPAHPYTRLLLSAIPDFAQEGYAAHTDYTGEGVQREDVPGACCFYHRCPHATDVCLHKPQLRPAATPGAKENGHLSRCILNMT